MGPARSGVPSGSWPSSTRGPGKRVDRRRTSGYRRRMKAPGAEVGRQPVYAIGSASHPTSLLVPPDHRRVRRRTVLDARTVRLDSAATRRGKGLGRGLLRRRLRRRPVGDVRH